jgi:glycine cleavage system H protein
MTDAGLKFTKTHEWLRIEGETAVVGLSEYAQNELGDIVFIELPEKGKKVDAGQVLTTVESVKSVSEIYAPVGGEVTETNRDLEGEPGLVNNDPYGRGWILKLRMAPGADLSGLLSEDEYERHTKE